MVDNTVLFKTKYSQQLYQALNDVYGRKVKVIFLVPRNKRCHNVVTVPKKHIIFLWTEYLYPFQIFKALMKIKPDLLHIQLEQVTFGSIFAMALVPFLLMLSRIGGIPSIVTLHGVVPVQEFDNTMKETLLPRSRIPTSIMKFAIILFYKLVSYTASALIVFSETFKKLLMTYHVSESKIHIIPHGVEKIGATESNLFDSNGTIVEKIKDKRICLFFGYISPRKGLEYLVRAWSHIYYRHPEYVLVIAGGTTRYNDYYNFIKEEVKRLCPHGSVLITGYLSDNEVAMLFERAEFIVLPYVYSDSASGPLAIAQSYGKPVIASKVGIFIDEVRNSGLLVQPRDAIALANAIDLMINDEELRAKMSENAKKNALERSWKHVAQLHFSLWTAIARN